MHLCIHLGASNWVGFRLSICTLHSRQDTIGHLDQDHWFDGPQRPLSSLFDIHLSRLGTNCHSTVVNQIQYESQQNEGAS